MAMELEKEINTKIKLTTDYDNDVQYMAAVHLVDIVIRDAPRIHPQKMTEIVDSMLNHIDSDSDMLQNNSIKCLAEIIKELPPGLCSRVVNRIVNRIRDPKTNNMVSVYANGLITIIKEVDYQYGYQLKDLLSMIASVIYEVKARTDQKNQAINDDTLIHLINVSEAFLRKWPSIIKTTQFDRHRFLEHLVGNLSNSKLSKRSYLCLGAMAHSITEAELELLFSQQNGLIGMIRSLNSFSKSKEYFYALAAILRAKNPSIEERVPTMYSFLMEETRKMMAYPDLADQQERTDLISKLIDSNVSAVSSLVENFPDRFRELSEGTLAQLVQTAKELIVFSPMFDIDYLKLSNVEEEQEEYYGEDEESDNSYLVRKSTLQLVGFLSSINPKFCEEFIDCSELFQSLKEAKQDVRFVSFSMFEGLFQGISVEEHSQIGEGLILRREISVFKEKLPLLLINILKEISQLLNSDKVDQPTKTGCCRLLRYMPRTFLHSLTTRSDIVENVYSITLDILMKSKVTEIQILLANTIQYLSRFQHQNYSLEAVKRIISLLSATTNQGVIKAHFNAIACHLCDNLQCFAQNYPIIEQIVDLVHKYSTQRLDQSTRISINDTILMLINHYHNVIPQSSIASLVTIINEKLTSETNKIHLLNGIKSLPSSLTTSTQTTSALHQCLLNISGHLINNKIVAVKQGAHDSILALMAVLRNNLTEDLVRAIIEHSNSLIDGRQFPPYLVQLSKVYPHLFVKHIPRLLNLQGTSSNVVRDIILANKISYPQTLQDVRAVLNPSNFLLCAEILSGLKPKIQELQQQVEDSIWGFLCLRLIGMSNDVRYFEFLQKHCRGGMSSKFKEHARLALGDLGALNVESSIPKLLDEINSANEEEMDLVFISLKQCILKADARAFATIQNTLNYLFSLVQNNTIHNESIINGISICVAKFFDSDPKQALPLLTNLSSSPSENLRYIFATSMSSVNSCLFRRDFFNKLVALMKDSTSKVKTSAVKSLNNLINANPAEMSDYVDQSLFRIVHEASLFDPKQVVVEMIGIKTMVDKGEPLRIQAFSIMETIVANNLCSRLNLNEVTRMSLERMEQDSSEDVLIHRLDLLRLVSRVSRSLSQFEGDFVTKLDPKTGVLKTYVHENQNEAAKKASLNVVRRVFEICLNCRAYNCLLIENLNQQLKVIPKFAELIQSNNES